MYTQSLKLFSLFVIIGIEHKKLDAIDAIFLLNFPSLRIVFLIAIMASLYEGVALPLNSV